MLIADFILARLDEDEVTAGADLRVHADIRAKRAIVASLRPVAEDECEYSGWVEFAERPLRALADLWPDHADREGVELQSDNCVSA